jgi:CheY-like chemotaxis protein
MSDIPPGFLEGWNIVVVDDEWDSLTVAQIILEFYGAIVRTAENGRDGLKLIKTAPPKLVISDLSMPEMDGWTLLRHLREHYTTCDIPVIALTAHAMLGDRERALAAGFNNYMTKPLSADTFIEHLVSIIRTIPVLRAELTF